MCRDHEESFTGPELLFFRYTFSVASPGCSSGDLYVRPMQALFAAQAASLALIVVLRGQPGRSPPRASDPGCAQNPLAHAAPAAHHCHVSQESPAAQQACKHASVDAASEIFVPEVQCVLPMSSGNVCGPHCCCCTAAAAAWAVRTENSNTDIIHDTASRTHITGIVLRCMREGRNTGWHRITSRVARPPHPPRRLAGDHQRRAISPRPRRSSREVIRCRPPPGCQEAVQPGGGGGGGGCRGRISL
jgi:hypothetical protein